MASKLMEEHKRWTVTYTKHIRQKRKVYQDGVLEHHCSSNKILLYDNSGKLLDSRFLKKDDLVECGVTLTFESHLVDLCDYDETHKPLKDCKLHDSGEKSTEKAKRYGQISTNSSLGNKQIKVLTNRKVQNQPNPIPAAMREWDVLYTSQITQKAKRYHDGILKFVSYGSHMNQLILLKEDGSVLSNKFQKSAECLSIGSTCEMPNYLLEISQERNMQGGLEEPKDNSPDKKVVISSGVGRFTKGEEGSMKKQLHRDGLEEPKDNSPDKKVLISSGVGRLTKGEEGSMKKQLHRDAFQILSALKRSPQHSLVHENPLVDTASPRYLGLSHSDLPGCEISSDVRKLVNPDCKVELWTVNHSPSSSILYGEGPCKSPITNLGVDSTVKNFLHLGTTSIASEASDGGRICIKEPHGSHAEEGSLQGSGDCMGLNSNALHNKEHGNSGTCSQLHSDNMDPENGGLEGFHSLSTSGLDCAEAFPSINIDEKSSEVKASPGEATMADEYPSFELGFEL